MSISPIVARQYILGHQGLWPGRRVAGKDGAATIIHQIGGVQVDPINVVARSHDIVLWGRVADYRPEQLVLLYHDRAFFDLSQSCAAIVYLLISQYDRVRYIIWHGEALVCSENICC